ncbi:hypothetical protein BKA70DRAFT_1087615 [Coprinopsis sp. MPI-PUGE-AT-0042]|nr:hypothetical protein BKA70DRAFT_1087615 [Coprinopsis sp. MPI-PUGE-AT-0042]
MTSVNPDRPPYVGTRRKLVLALDVGTTFSGVSYSILDPGQPPEIKGVTRYPAHEQVSGASKIPTVIYYDRAGNAVAVGAEALREGVYEIAEEEGWSKAEWFKMHIRPRNEATTEVSARIPPLPRNKTVVQVLADYLIYLFRCARDYIQVTHANGRDLWNSVESDIEYVISHPNGWEGYQQSQMREAVVLAGFIPNTVEGHQRVSFVTEGEASLHFSIRNGLPDGAMQKGDGVVIVDAGGGTIDISTYSRKLQKGGQSGPINFEEIAAPQCFFFGAVFVSINARLFLEKFLEESDFMDDLDHIVRCFDKTTKTRFSDDSQPQYVKFGSTRDNDANCNIRFGQLKMDGKDVASFFEPSVNCVVDAVKEQLKNAHKEIKHVVLVGGFAASDWLFNQVNSRLSKDGLNVVRPEIYVNKAVSDGAISFHLDHMVKTRVSKVAYGTFRQIEYEMDDPEHIKRKDKMKVMPSGRQLIPDAFATILPKNTQVSEEKEFKKYFWKEADTKGELYLDNVQSSLWCYTGDDANPCWKDVETEKYKKLCTIELDLSHLPISPCPRLNGAAGEFYKLEYGYAVTFSAVELKVCLTWTEDGVEKRGPAKVVFEPED